MTTVAEAVEGLAEANLITRRTRTLAAPTATVERAFRKMWRAQRLAIVKALATHKAEFGPLEESISDSDWADDWDRISRATTGQVVTALDAAYPKAIAGGARHVLADVAVDVPDHHDGFDVDHPDAVRWMDGRGAARVTAINDETRTQIRTILSQATDEGWSWTRTAREIEGRFAGFSTPATQAHLRTRAELVATNEMAEAYEHGSHIARSDLADAGLEVEKGWLTVGDDRVSEECISDQGVGWIGFDEEFPSGESNPPAHPGCRCTSTSRVVT